MKNLDHVWKNPPQEPILSGGEIHIWRASLEQPDIRVQELARILSVDERLRAERFHFERDRRRFIVCRGLLRTILCQYLKIKPDRLRFQYNPQGKPYLSKELLNDAIRFNLSHSFELALYTFVYNRQVGIDVEFIRPIKDIEQIAAKFFSKNEHTRLKALSGNQKLEGFFNCWTRKEAYIKATGEGFGRSLDQFEVSLAPGEPSRLLNVEGLPEEAARWSLEAFTPSDGYTAAIAVEGPDCQFEWFSISSNS